jgi:hypothetical protein
LTGMLIFTATWYRRRTSWAIITALSAVMRYTFFEGRRQKAEGRSYKFWLMYLVTEGTAVTNTRTRSRSFVSIFTPDSGGQILLLFGDNSSSEFAHHLKL